MAVYKTFLLLCGIQYKKCLKAMEFLHLSAQKLTKKKVRKKSCLKTTAINIFEEKVQDLPMQTTPTLYA